MPEAREERCLNEKQKKDVEWMSYVSNLMTDNQIISGDKEEEMHVKQIFLPYSDSAWGYENFQPQKKVKIDNIPRPNSKDINPSVSI